MGPARCTCFRRLAGGGSVLAISTNGWRHLTGGSKIAEVDFAYKTNGFLWFFNLPMQACANQAIFEKAKKWLLPSVGMSFLKKACIINFRKCGSYRGRQSFFRGSSEGAFGTIDGNPRVKRRVVERVICRLRRVQKTTFMQLENRGFQQGENYYKTAAKIKIRPRQRRPKNGPNGKTRNASESRFRKMCEKPLVLYYFFKKWNAWYVRNAFCPA